MRAVRRSDVSGQDKRGLTMVRSRSDLLTLIEQYVTDSGTTFVSIVLGRRPVKYYQQRLWLASISAFGCCILAVMDTPTTDSSPPQQQQKQQAQQQQGVVPSGGPCVGYQSSISP